MATQAGVSVDTVRLYERRGLVRTLERTPAGYRVFTPAAVDRIRVTRRLAALGMTLEEIAGALAAAGGVTDCSTEVWRLEQIRARVQVRRDELDTIGQELTRVIDDCRAHHCRIHTQEP